MDSRGEAGHNIDSEKDVNAINRQLITYLVTRRCVGRLESVLTREGEVDEVVVTFVDFKVV